VYCSCVLAMPSENRTVLITCNIFEPPPSPFTTGAVIGGWAGESVCPVAPGTWQSPDRESQTVPFVQSEGTHAGWPQL
jgi:hypothetical protein